MGQLSTLPVGILVVGNYTKTPGKESKLNVLQEKAVIVIVIL